MENEGTENDKPNAELVKRQYRAKSRRDPITFFLPVLLLGPSFCSPAFPLG